ncbi:serine/threonine-protein kinase prp4-like isoform X12 [Nymphaea colorata]|nr:serine/threonine-protein kinase prp4-like isoform X12 [Nymphaea colorata]
MILYQNVNEAKNVLKLCNFGNAMFAGKNDTIVVSLFILGLPYDHALDIWSVGCCLYELYTGKVLFPGPSNNDMLRLHMELKGPFHKKMLRKGAFTNHHFDQDLNFHATEEDPVTKKVVNMMDGKVDDLKLLYRSYLMQTFYNGHIEEKKNVDEAKNVLKLCDFGNAMFAGKNEITP